VGNDPSYGARPLKRAIVSEIETPIAKRLLAGTIRDGEALQADYGREKGGIVFETQPVTA